MKRLFGILFIISFLILFNIYSTNKSNAEEINTISYNQIIQRKTEPTYPVRLRIPSIKVSSNIENLSIINGEMEDPLKSENVGWYTEGVMPGMTGNAVISGHLDDKDGEPAIFWNLANLLIGDTLSIEDSNGLNQHFKVKNIKEYDKNKLPLTTFFTNSRGKNLILITCSGEYIDSLNDYSKRLVVYSELVE